MDNRKRRGRIESLTGKIFILSLFLVLLINLIVPDKEQSEQENRMLETMPKLSLTGILTGDFMEQWESYMSDQFAGRNLLRGLKVKLDRLGGSRMENGVIIGKDGQLFEDIAVPDDGLFTDNINAVKSFADAYPLCGDVSGHPDDSHADPGRGVYPERQPACLRDCGRPEPDVQYGGARAWGFGQLGGRVFRSE